MKQQDQQGIELMLKKTMQPISCHADAELRRDLWPAMLKRLEASPARIPWFDWALLAAVASLLIFFPGAIPVLLYHL
jgi:hypothetical protein